MGLIILGALKFFLAVLFLPSVIACIVAFITHLQVYPATYEEFLIWGIIAFLILYLFFFQFWWVYELGQGIVGNMTRFLSPLDKVITNMVPIYLILVFVIFFIVTDFFKLKTHDPWFVFFIGFALSMHIILVAQELQNQEKTPIKPSYLLEMCFIFVITLCSSVMLMDWIVGKWTFPEFLDNMAANSLLYYQNILSKLTSQ